MKKKICKTGDVIQIGTKEKATMETFHKESDSLLVMFDILAEKQRRHQERFWNTIYDLYPEAKGFDLHADWKKGRITLRGEKKTEE